MSGVIADHAQYDSSRLLLFLFPGQIGCHPQFLKFTVRMLSRAVDV